MHVISLAGTTSVKNPRTEQVHEAGPDGVFRDIPLDFAHELVTRHASHWRELSAHEAAKNIAALEELRNPHQLPKAVAELRGRADGFESRIAALEAHIGREHSHEFDGLLATVQGDYVAEHGAAAEPVPAEKPTRARKTAAAKTTAGKRPAGARKGAAAKPKDDGPAEEADLEDESVDDSAE